ncbi:MAG: hypothetical protein RLY31_1185 [Bacteroidota bacterium]
MTRCAADPAGSGKPSDGPADAGISVTPYGTTPAGDTVELYTLRNEQGMTVEIITYGGIITSWTAPDKDGRYENVVLGFDGLPDYLQRNPYFGALVGRYGNRIAGGRFSLDGKAYQLERNDGDNHLHGGHSGLDKVVWKATPAPADQGVALRLEHVSPAGAGGYPGTLSVSVTYHLLPDNSLDVLYEATSDEPTIVNLTQHSYFNLSGHFDRDILDHELEIRADAFLPVDTALIPIGAMQPVVGNPFDFRTPKPIGQDIGAADEQLRRGGGYDHCWVLSDPGTFRRVASALHPGSGRLLEVFTDEPGLQFYCGNFLDGTLPAPGGGNYGHRSGFCLETQHFPDSPNQPVFPSVVLRPGDVYTSRTSFRFSTR